MSRSLKELIILQFKEYWREPEVLFWTLGFPIMVASVLGLLYSFKPPVHFKAAIVLTQSAESSQFESFLKEGEIRIPGKNIRTINFIKMELASAENEYRKGNIEIILKIDSTDRLSYYFDPANERAENLYLWIDNRLREETTSFKSEVISQTQPGNRYIDYLIPGLIALGIMNATLWGIGWTLIEFRIKKFLRRMIATPMRKIDFLLSISITRLALSIIEASLLYTFAHFVFGINLKGNLHSVFLLFLSGHIAFSGLSILIASRTTNTRIGNGLINIITMPMFLLSGVFFSYHSFPEAMISFIQYLPLTVLADSMREVFLFGGNIASIAFPVFYLTGFGIIFYLLGLKIYRWY